MDHIRRSPPTESLGHRFFSYVLAVLLVPLVLVTTSIAYNAPLVVAGVLLPLAMLVLAFRALNRRAYAAQFKIRRAMLAHRKIQESNMADIMRAGEAWQLFHEKQDIAAKNAYATRHYISGLSSAGLVSGLGFSVFAVGIMKGYLASSLLRESVDAGDSTTEIVGRSDGVVAFYSALARYGILTRDDNGEDVFVHLSAVEDAGLPELVIGQRFSFTLERKGSFISAINLKIKKRAAAEHDIESGPEKLSASRDPLRNERVAGTVEMYDATRGMGFIALNDGRPKVVVFANSLQESGLTTLMVGDRLEFDLEKNLLSGYIAVNLRGI